ncbi:hypothetical protein JMF94_03500 [Desulfovibrio sp. UIB00]|uniref:hypothetical protein n=1 Tax=Desulfovibrio sp. UIB00 TaxID=2804314 RepID=UPI001F0E3143|nr:hypothetical protein [Desulfovibrio sp. UIB00]MCH5144144.1 hypothetical protein [Desulfovibrio sp. UIB00]
MSVNEELLTSMLDTYKKKVDEAVDSIAQTIFKQCYQGSEALAKLIEKSVQEKNIPQISLDVINLKLFLSHNIGGIQIHVPIYSSGLPNKDLNSTYKEMLSPLEFSYLPNKVICITESGGSYEEAVEKAKPLIDTLKLYTKVTKNIFNDSRNNLAGTLTKKVKVSIDEVDAKNNLCKKLKTRLLQDS